MEVSFTPEQLEQLTEIGTRSGKAPEQVVTELVTKALEDDARFREAVQLGIDQANRGEFIEEEEMDARVREMLR
jgi:hypothetical protein